MTIARPADAQRRAARVPPLAIAAWVVALLVLAALVTAVVDYLGSGQHQMHGMHTADALTRAGGETPSTGLTFTRLFTVWHLDAVALAVLVLLAAVYLTGVGLVSVRGPGRRWPLRNTAAFLAGLVVAGYATNGAIAVYDQVLFTAHMAGHLALVMVAPALLVGGRPLALAVRAAPVRRRARIEAVARGRVVALLTAPPVALAVYTVVIVGSHLTGIMNTIMRNTWAGQVEHLVYLVAGLVFFVLIVGHEPIRWNLGAPARFLLLALAMAVDTLTGIVLMQGSGAVDLMPSALHVDALADTRAGGAIMWVGGDAIMAVIMVGLVIKWLRSVESAPAERGWLEQARSAAFTAHTGDAHAAEAIDDADEAARESYNAWLAGLDER